jgi:hypothetical protein
MDTEYLGTFLNIGQLLYGPKHEELKGLINNTLMTGLNSSNCVIHHNMRWLKKHYDCKDMDTETFYSELTKQLLNCPLEPQAFKKGATFSPYFDTDSSPIFGKTNILTFFYAKDNDLLNIVVGIPSMEEADKILFKCSKFFPL